MKIDIKRAIKITMPPAEAEIVIEHIETLKSQNARLLEALKKITSWAEQEVGFWNDEHPIEAARAVIAEAENTDFAPYSKRLGEVLPEVIARAKSNNLAANTFELDELRNKAWRLSEIENFLECENLTDEFEEWYLDKQHELAAKHDPTL